jgi:glycine cleavage system H protein
LIRDVDETRESAQVVPDELKYTAEHEWVAQIGADSVRIGITDYAQQQLGDVVFVQLPETGERVTVGQTLGEVESTKSVSDIFAPVEGEVTARNDALDERPELINSDPYGDGWMLELRLVDTASVDGLMDAAAYRELAQTD